ncbi:hypothetical protein AVEN_219028-1 [Araneus ventricosus]|uniref:C2H2-type domain-containing protein n=1 Tax=Araneus ventricosus TaxID=182803 RepID=A0A4Y2WLK7_ARAVE|nr:hypothetical protein AVEN_219028-1 [Araneus ventricosus]
MYRVCDVCKKAFTRKHTLKRHMKKHGNHSNRICSKCPMKFYRMAKLQEHILNHTREKKTYPCESCDQVFPLMSDILRHKRVYHSAPTYSRVATPRARNSCRNALGVYSFHFMTTGSLDFLLFLDEDRQEMHDMIQFDLEGKRKCFVWSVLAALHPVELHPERVSHYFSLEQERLSGNVTCPVQPCKIPIIDKLNNLRINVFGCEDEKVFPLYISKREDTQVINLLYITQGDDKHYCLIRNMSQLLFYLSKYSGERLYCYSCLHCFTTDPLLKAHLPYCNEYNPQRIIMLEPGEDRVLEFKQQKFLQALPHEIIVIPNTMEKYISFSIR